MKLVVGLGNPGKRYERTRHNVGFMMLDSLAKDLGIKFKENKARKVLFAKTDNIELIKPQTFMNRSGMPLSAIAKKHNVAPKDILVISDDIDMELGKLRYREGGSSGGHRGLQSIIDHLGANKFPRLKVGIGRPNTLAPDEYVTSNFSITQLSQIKKILPQAVAIIQSKFLK
ncbi:aminoacyl-tRNA hydrolase [candidate division Kazan bacterium RBG_13_50_9]|uniref:Peptidyl-tRNA hydrolase n=1 Tax=candidate division Kazan bacterium RBG_13_50_9 TaxID=1798535 RepID=A0A1F4NTB8_UNCK3|nr:MAG: aminoacyl-tRNA hydrolase [candidate division Kazan bacterium RBG_13_50_9]